MLSEFESESDIILSPLVLFQIKMFVKSNCIFSSFKKSSCMSVCSLLGVGCEKMASRVSDGVQNLPKTYLPTSSFLDNQK